MTALEVARRVLDTETCHYFQHTPAPARCLYCGSEGERIEIIGEIAGFSDPVCCHRPIGEKPPPEVYDYVARPFNTFPEPRSEEDEAAGVPQHPDLDGWIAFDLFSASALVQVYDAVNAKNQARLEQYSLPEMVRLAFMCIKADELWRK